MLSVALNERTMFGDFDLEKEIIYFKIGSEGLVSLHAHNYSRRVQLSPSDLKRLTKSKGYYAISSNCYINLSRIRSIISGIVYFGNEQNSTKMLSVSKRTEQKIKQLLAV
ncbi:MULTISPECIES: LytTR family transcriptional regulator DNA-binding domain-containing protein [Paenibacillus]|uniref:LytTR family transcriptional regulator DNA-binding domain-containing protein n=1 Tax=Paenibacillus TaxID=44249 RepID=UPI0020416123|nr:LytTR family transcriptional regulator DNA-binding domain-containing protein [Paenibacillus camelliae]MCM3635211.1 LytTR family transcriptional regulator DNA-binding domain-containing protein [Paenibacillus camelliae]